MNTKISLAILGIMLAHFLGPIDCTPDQIGRASTAVKTFQDSWDKNVLPILDDPWKKMAQELNSQVHDTKNFAAVSSANPCFSAYYHPTLKRFVDFSEGNFPENERGNISILFGSLSDVGESRSSLWIVKCPGKIWQIKGVLWAKTGKLVLVYAEKDGDSPPTQSRPSPGAGPVVP